MFKFKIETDKETKTAYVYAPFHADFNNFLKNKCAGKWERSAWHVASEFISDIRVKMKEFFGRDDTFCEKLVSLKINFRKKVIGREISILGRTILYQKSAEIKKGYGVIIASNTYQLTKGEIEVDAGAQVIIRDFPLPKLSEIITSLDSNIEVKIIHDEYDLQMLKAERESLTERLNEIEKMIQKQKMEDEKNAI